MPVTFEYPQGHMAERPTRCERTDMDFTPILFGILAINLGVLGAGTMLAMVRTVRDSRPDHRQRIPRHATVGRPTR